MVEPKTAKPTFKFLAGWLCLDFVNTRNWDSRDPSYERFKAYSDFVWWNHQAGILTDSETQSLVLAGQNRLTEAAAVFERSMILREAVYQIFSAIVSGLTPDKTNLSTLNAALSESLAHLRLVPAGEGFAWAWSGEENKLERVFWPVVRSAAELLTSNKLDILGKCAGDSCGWLFLDLSRNHSRRWCDMKHCGNQAKARRHYRRRRAAGTQG